jgi:3,5-epimerase/4-reductase
MVVMKILIYGHQGWIGTQFVDILKADHDVQFFASRVRCDDYEALCLEIEKIRPTHLVSFIGRTHGFHDDKYYSTIDFLEQPGRLVDNIRDNLFSPVLLALLGMQYGIHFTYLGTGCIFEYDDLHVFGSETSGFLETSNPNFFGSSYSIVKGFTDRFMRILSKHVLQLRIRMPIVGYKHPRNFISKIVGYEKICSIPNSMSVLPDLLPVMLDMMKRNKTGTYNFTNPGLISHNEILDMYKEFCDPEFTYCNFSVDEQNLILDSKRSNNCLDTSKLLDEYPFIPHIRDSVRRILQNYR